MLFHAVIVSKLENYKPYCSDINISIYSITTYYKFLSAYLKQVIIQSQVHLNSQQVYIASDQRLGLVWFSR